MLSVTPVVDEPGLRFGVRIGGHGPHSPATQWTHQDRDVLVDECLDGGEAGSGAAWFTIPEHLHGTQLAAGQEPATFIVLVEVTERTRGIPGAEAQTE